ncbi:embryonic stem cell-related gene protein-like [Macaca mulatta]
MLFGRRPGSSTELEEDMLYSWPWHDELLLLNKDCFKANHWEKLDSALLHPGEINSLVAHTKPVWWSLHMDVRETWCRRPGSAGLLWETSPLSSPSLHEEIHLRPRVLRPTSPRNISPISNQDPTGNRTVQLAWQPLPDPLELWPKAL